MKAVRKVYEKGGEVRDNNGNLLSANDVRKLRTYDSGATGTSPSNSARDYEKKSVVAPTPKQFLNQTTEKELIKALKSSEPNGNWRNLTGKKLISAAKTKGVYQEGRQAAVAVYRKKYGEGLQK